MYSFFTFKRNLSQSRLVLQAVVLSDACTVFTYIRWITSDTHSEKCFLFAWKECLTEQVHFLHTASRATC